MAPVNSFQPVGAVSSKQQSFETTTSRLNEYRTTTKSTRSSAIGMSSVSVDYHATYNFGPASSRDSIVYSAERPGNDPDSKTTRVNNEQVMDWINFMKNQGVTNVIVLLDDNEFDIYDYPGLLDIYKQQGISYIWQSMDEPNASKKIYSFVNNVKKMGGKVVTHCTGGIGRCGRVAAGWLVCEYGLSPEQATKETLLHAQISGVTRGGDAKKLQAWLA